MRKSLFFLFFVLLAVPASSNAPRSDVELSAVRLREAAALYYRDVFPDNYVLEPEIMADERLISVRLYDISNKSDWTAFLDNLGYRIERRGNVDFVVAKQKKEDAFDDEIFVYRPLYKTAEELKGAISGLFVGIIGGDKNELIFKGTKRDIKTIKEALKHFDKKQKELVIKGYIYEVTTTKSDASGLSIVADVFKNAGVAITNGTKLSNFLSFKNSDVDFYFSALSKDDRFKILSRPSLRVRNHQSATLTVGRDVPTLGNVTYQDGQAVQSVTYRSSGVIFEIVPEILRKTVNLQIRQEMSNFAETVNGVNGSPTLVKRELKTNVTASSGETLVLGGLIENKDTDSSAGLSFLPSWTGAKSNTKENTEILLMLYVEII